MRLADKEMADWRKVEVHVEALMLLFISNTNISDEKRDVAFDALYEALCVVSDLRSEL